MPKFTPLILAFAAALILTACNQAPSATPPQSTQGQSAYAKLHGKTMGTSYNISFDNEAKLDTTKLQQIIDEQLIAINKSMSTYDDTATIMAFNRADIGQVIEIDTDFQKVLADSRVIFEKSGGAFDPTVMPLVSLWGFGKELTAERLSNPPTDDEIAKARESIGLDKVVGTDKIQKTHTGVGLDFSAIAKGHAVDKVADILAKQGINSFMVEIGGEIATRGKNPDGKTWTIGIDKPIAGSTVQNRELLTALPLGDDHMATSGSYRNFLEYNGVQYSHTIDPKTAYPVKDSAHSITVLADTTALADGWATALSAMPMEQAVDLAEKENLAVLFVGKNTDKLNIVQSSAFKIKFPKLNLPSKQ